MNMLITEWNLEEAQRVWLAEGGAGNAEIPIDSQRN